MIKEISDAAAQIIGLTRDMKGHKDDIRGLKSDLKDVHNELENVNRRIDDVSRALERLAYEIRSVKDNDAHERRILTLELERVIMQFERRLPLPSSKE